MADVATRTGFTREVLDGLPASTPFIRALRERAFEEFVALPIPSPETEEWRYTDLSDFDLSFAPFTAGSTARTLDEVPEAVQAVAGEVGDRSGLLIQLNSEPLIAHLDPSEAAKGVAFLDLDAAAARPMDRRPRALRRRFGGEAADAARLLARLPDEPVHAQPQGALHEAGLHSLLARSPPPAGTMIGV